MYEDASEDVSRAEGALMASEVGANPDYDRIRERERILAQAESDQRTVEISVRAAGCSNGLDAFRREYYGEN